MTISEYKKHKVYLNKFVNKFKDEAFNEGVDITTPEFELLIENIIKKYLDNKGISYEEFKKIEDEIKEGKELEESEVLYIPELARKSKENRKKLAEEIKNEIKEIKKIVLETLNNFKNQYDASSLNIKSFEKKLKEINFLAERALDNSNKIQTIKETREIIKQIDNVKVDELNKNILKIQSDFINLSNKTGKEITVSKQFMAGFDGEVSNKVKELISPEINRVVRSLQSQIFATNKNTENLRSESNSYIIGNGVRKCTVSATEPTNPTEGELWIDIS